MSYLGFLLVLACSLSAAGSSIFLRISIDKIGGFSFNLDSILKISTSPLFLAGLVLYGMTGFIWLKILATEELSVAYPLLIGLTFMLVSVGAVVFFREHISIIKFVGFVFIVLGIYVVTKGS